VEPERGHADGEPEPCVEHEVERTANDRVPPAARKAAERELETEEEKEEHDPELGDELGHLGGVDQAEHLRLVRPEQEPREQVRRDRRKPEAARDEAEEAERRDRDGELGEGQRVSPVAMPHANQLPWKAPGAGRDVPRGERREGVSSGSRRTEAGMKANQGWTPTEKVLYTSLLPVLAVVGTLAFFSVMQAQDRSATSAAARPLDAAIDPAEAARDAARNVFRDCMKSMGADTGSTRFRSRFSPRPDVKKIREASEVCRDVLETRPPPTTSPRGTNTPPIL
jgi:hypothetical protein